MASRSFEDSSGIRWEVFEVRRTSATPRGVSHGLEQGWLAFVSPDGKRRLAPFPAEWHVAEDSELERLCGTARIANPPRFDETRPRIRTPRADRTAPPAAPPLEPSSETSLVRDVVRMFAQQARRDKTPAIAAMVLLKALLAERYGGEVQDASTQSDLGDVRRIRRWFVEAYYFERPA